MAILLTKPTENPYTQFVHTKTPSFLLVLLVLFCCSSCFLFNTKVGDTGIHKGILTLEENFEQVKLFGAWAFWPNEFVAPSINFDEKNISNYDCFPSSWSQNKKIKLKRKGYASYALKIEGLNPKFEYAFYFPSYSSAARYYVNGIEIYSQGRPGENTEFEIADWKTAVVAVPKTGATSLTLVMHLSNFYDQYPGGLLPIQFGTWESMSREKSVTRIKRIIPFGALMSIGLYLIFMFLFNPKEYSALYLGLLCLIFAFQIICYNEFLLQDFFAHISGPVMFRLGYVTFPLAVACFCRFLQNLYSHLVDKKKARVVFAVSLLYSVCITFFPVSVFTALLIPFQIFTIISCLWFLIVIIKAFKQKEKESRYFLVGFIFFFIIIVRDVFLINRIFTGVFLAHYGVLGIIATMCFMVAGRFTHAFVSVENASLELQTLNNSLQRFIPADFVHYLGKNSITEVSPGDTISKDMCIMVAHFGYDVLDSHNTGSVGMLEVYNTLLKSINPIVRKYNGFIETYLSDGVVVLFPDDSRKLVICSLDILTVIEDENKLRSLESLPLFCFSAGLHRGAVTMGTVGVPERLGSLVVSDALTIATRIAEFSFSHKLSVLLSSECASSLGYNEEPCCELVPLDDICLDAKQVSVSVFEVRSL